MYVEVMNKQRLWAVLRN